MTFIVVGAAISGALWVIALVTANPRSKAPPWLCGALFALAALITLSFALVAAWYVIPTANNNEVGWEQWLAFVAAPFVALGVLYRMLAGHFNDNLRIEVTAQSINDSQAVITLTPEKGDSGSIRLLDVIAVIETDMTRVSTRVSRPFLPELELKKRALGPAPRGHQNLVLSPGDRAQLSWTVMATPTERIDIGILGRKHPFQTFFHHPQWRSSCVVTR